MPQRPVVDAVRLWWLADPVQVVCQAAFLLTALILVLAFAAEGEPGAALACLVGFGIWATTAAGRVRAFRRRFTGSVADDPITTPRLVIRAVRSDDAQALRATIDDEVRRANGWTRRTERQILRLVRRDLASHLGVLVITDHQDEVVGEAQANPRPDGSAWEIGWWVGPGHRGQGHATEAVGALVARLHDRGASKVVFGTAADNVAIRRIAEKLGAVVESNAPVRLPDGSTPAAIWYAHGRYVPQP